MASNYLEALLLTSYISLLNHGCDLVKETPAAEPRVQTQQVPVAPKPKLPQKPKARKIDHAEYRLRGTVLSYAAQPQYPGDNFITNLTGMPVKLELYYLV